jgi:hypothetical protein
MIDALANMFQQLRLEPGTYRYELPEQEIVVEVRPRKALNANQILGGQLEQKVEEAMTIDESCIMLDPWVELPTPKPIGRVVGRLAPMPPPDIPEFPPEDEIP